MRGRAQPGVRTCRPDPDPRIFHAIGDEIVVPASNLQKLGMVIREPGTDRLEDSLRPDARLHKLSHYVLI
jgi:hypothetical protein